MMEGNGTENPCSRTLGWLQQDNDAKPWLWKFSNCFSRPEQTLPLGPQTKESMEDKKAAVELKDVPSPLHIGSKLFPAVPLPDIHSLQQPTVQLSTVPKVSCYAHCTNEPSTSPMRFGGAGGGGSSGGSGSWIHTGTLVDAQSTRTITCQVGSGFAFQSSSSLQNASARNNLTGIASDFPSMCVESNVSACKHLPCCGKHHFPSCHSNVHKLHQFPTLQGCTSAGYFPCSDFPSGAPGHLEEHLSQSELTPHLCTNSLHQNVVPPVCLKGSLYCEDCLNKPARNSIIDAAKVWPNIPPPSTQLAPRAIPLCNGCGTKGTGKETALLLATSLSKATSKFGSPEVSIAGQVLENLPPIGVFWDIENCSVPSGRSATTVVQRIREKFFKGHREAEFICVCDISKENKEVIQELNNCQVTVAHINATAKNAADDKLRQSLRRFANTHTAPATVVLVSTDVNFALELSDLRHRHGFHIILVHKNQASEALLHHAHELIGFEEFISDLPPRLPLKMPCHTLLYVYNLPANKDGKSISNRLRRLSDNCGGKVLSITGCSAILRFINQDSAERAQKRMENEDVFGNRIIVSFTPKNRELCEAKSSNAVADKAKSPKKVKNMKLCLIKDTSEQSSSAKATPGKGPQTNSGSATKNTHVKSLQELCRLEPKTGNRNTEHQQGHLRLAALPHSGPSTAAPTPKTMGVAEPLCRSSQKKENLSVRSATSSPIEKREKEEEAVFQVSYPSAFSKMIASRQVSPLLTAQSWSPSRSMSPNLLNGGPPLTFNVANPSSGTDYPDPFANGADVQVSNIDYRLSRKELQQLIQEAFSRHGKVKSVELSPHTDYQLKAIVQMENLQEAICAMNSLHRYKIGNKKILVSLATGAANKSLSLLSAETVSILQDAPACCLPLFKFTDIYEKKFGHKLNVSDLYKLTDTIAVREQGTGRLVCLLPSSQARQSPLGSSQSHDGSSTNCSPIIFEELEYHEPVCRQHCSNKNFSEHEFEPDSYKIPFVVLSLKTFAPQVHSLLQTHEGTVPLLSFPDCYAAEFGDLEIMWESHGGVPLEHFITCIPGVNIATAQNGVKVVKWIHNKPPPPNTDPWLLRSKSPVGNPQLIQFSREVIDLLKNQPSCVIPISNFIPSYHHHFAKQCRVSDYGYSKLIELLEAVPHVLQILGMGSKRLLTLTHRAQVKRFTQDLLKLLKSQASKQVIVREFSQAYHWCFSKDWDVTEYGVCELVDILSEIPDTICLSQQDNDTVICIPKKERTQDEIERTKQFSKDVVDLLRHQPHFRMPFNKFIPSYHHHFGRQCKLAYYGFTKLLELFEAIPEVLQVLECGEEKILTLTEVERFKALAAQFVKLLRSQKDNCLMMTDLLTEYAKTFGYTFRLQDYDVSSISALTQKLCHVVKVADMDSGKQIQLINRKSLRSLTAQLLVLLMSWEGATYLSVDELRTHYETTHSTSLNPCEYGFMTLTELLKSLPYLVEVFTNDKTEEYVKLTSLYLFAKNVRSLLHTYHYQQIFLHEFSMAYTKYVGETLQPKTYGYNSVEELLGAIPQVVWIKGHGHKRIVVLKNDMKNRLCSLSLCSASHESQTADSKQILEVPELHTASELQLGAGGDGPSQKQELLHLASSSPVDLLCAPIPSCLPSPQLRPHPVVLQPADLIQFEERPQEPSEIMSLNHEENIETAVTVKKENPSSDSCLPCASAAALDPHGPSSEAPELLLSKDPVESPAKKQPKNRVKLAANFSFAPITKL